MRTLVNLTDLSANRQTHHLKFDSSYVILIASPYASQRSRTSLFNRRIGMTPLISRLHELLRCIWGCEIFRSDWGASILLPIPKKGDRKASGNYKCISPIEMAATIFCIQLPNRFAASRGCRTRPKQVGILMGYRLN